MGAALLLVGCASAGGRVPESGDATQLIARAEQQIAQAQQAGAESLAAANLGAARQAVADARAQLQIGETGRAALLARQATADAIYAAELARAEQAKQREQEARAALQAPPGGGDR
jgi:hypothetical protein